MLDIGTKQWYRLYGSPQPMATHVRDKLRMKYAREDEDGWEWDCVQTQFDLRGDEKTLALFVCRDNLNNVRRVSVAFPVFDIVRL
jgi:hypothetical protein